MARYEARSISSWLPYSDRQSKPITNLLTNVLIVSVKYTMLPSIHRSECANRGRALNTGRASNTGRGSNIIVLIEAGGFYSRKYGNYVHESSSNWSHTGQYHAYTGLDMPILNTGLRP